MEEQEILGKQIRVMVSEMKENGKRLTNEELYPPLYTPKTEYFLDALVDEVSTSSRRRLLVAGDGEAVLAFRTA